MAIHRHPPHDGGERPAGHLQPARGLPSALSRRVRRILVCHRLAQDDSGPGRGVREVRRLSFGLRRNRRHPLLPAGAYAWPRRGARRPAEARCAGISRRRLAGRARRPAPRLPLPALALRPRLRVQLRQNGSARRRTWFILDRRRSPPRRPQTRRLLLRPLHRGLQRQDRWELDARDACRASLLGRPARTASRRMDRLQRRIAGCLRRQGARGRRSAGQPLPSRLPGSLGRHHLHGLRHQAYPKGVVGPRAQAGRHPPRGRVLHRGRTARHGLQVPQRRPRGGTMSDLIAA